MLTRTMPKKKRPLKPKVNWPTLLKAERERRGLNQVEAATLCHLSQSQWSAFESGIRQPTRPIAFILTLFLEKKIP